MGNAGTDYSVVAPGAGRGAALFAQIRARGEFDEGASLEEHLWSYGQSPSGAGAGLVLLAREAGRSPVPVGWAGLEARTLSVGGRAQRAGLLVNLLVSPDHRTVRPALMLQRAARDAAMASFDLSFGFPNHAAVGGFVRAGYRRLGAFERYVCVLRYASYLERRGAPRTAARAMGGAADAFLAAARRVGSVRSRSGLSLDWVEELDDALAARIDGLWERAEAPRRWTLGRRDAAFVRWRHVCNPIEPGRIATLTGRGGELAGYAAVRMAGGRATVSDAFARDEPHLGALIDLLLERLYRQGASAVEIGFFGAARLIDMLERRGFRPRGAVHQVVVDVPRGSPLDAERLADPEAWCLMMGDGDR